MRIHWPPSPAVIAVVLITGCTLLIVSILLRRRAASSAGRFAAAVLLVLAAVWNGAIVFAFMSPHNRHVLHLATHRESVVVNAAIGVVWFGAAAFAVVKWFHRTAISQSV